MTTNKPLTINNLEDEITQLFLVSEKKLFADLKDFQKEIEELKRLLRLEVLDFVDSYGEDGKIDILQIISPLSNAQVAHMIKKATKQYNAYKDDEKPDTPYLKYLKRFIGQKNLKAIDVLEYQIKEVVEPSVASYEPYLVSILFNDYEKSDEEIRKTFALVFGIPITAKELNSYEIEKEIRAASYDNTIAKRLQQHKEVLIADIIAKTKRSAAITTSGKTLIDEINKSIKTLFNRIVVIARTESNRVFNKALRRSIASIDGVTQYRYSAKLDHRTSKICRRLNKKVFNLKDAMIGINMPPMHPNCRSTIVPVLPKGFTAM